MMKEKLEFEEYKMKLIAFEGDIISTSGNHDSEPDMSGGDGNGNVDDGGWGESPSIG